MVRLSRLFLILLALIFGVRLALAADNREANAFDTAMRTFKLAPELSEKDFADFVHNYPNSVRRPEAILYEARAMLSGGKVTNAIQLLSDQLLSTNHNDKLAPEYLYRLGLAHFQNNQYQAAANTFGDMIDKYPDSFYALDATVRQADAFVRLGQWSRLIDTLSRTNGLFQQSVHRGTVSGTIASGFLLLGEAQLALSNTNDVERTLRSLEAQSLNTQLKWQRDYLAARLQRAEGRLDEAYQTSTSLLATQDIANHAEGVAFQGGVLEQLGNLPAAANIYTNNLAADVSPDQQRRAILKIAELDLRLRKLPDAVQGLTKYLAQTPPPAAADLALLTLGEVRLKQALSGETNLFDHALVQLQKLTNSYPNSPVIGKALLDIGWCLWSQGRLAESLPEFRNAADRLPFSEEQAEARFKWADAQFAARDFAAAVTNYNSIAEKYLSLPEAKENRLIERALYQSARAALNEHDLIAATSALKNILAWYPNGLAGPSVLLLAGQGFVEQNNPAGARELFEEFEQLYPNNPLRSEVRLAIARSFEAEKNWDAAITNYTAWTGMFTNHHLLAQAQFSLAWDQYMAGRETNALMLFTNFIAHFPTNELSARAQFWIGDFYFRQGDSSAAEINYQLVFQNTNWPVSALTYEARMRAGRAATGYFNYKQAINYFTNLLALDCPPELRVQATFGYADATVAQDSTNKTADINEALRSLQTIVKNRTNSREAAQAWGKIGDCYFELGAKDPGQYTNAVTAYTKVIDATDASGDAIVQAHFKLGATLEKQAALKSGDDQTELMKNALRQYLTVFNDNAVSNALDEPSALWTKKSGMEAARVAESLQRWDVAVKIYGQLKDLLPMLGSVFDKKIAKAGEHL